MNKTSRDGYFINKFFYVHRGMHKTFCDDRDIKGLKLLKVP